MSDEQIPTDGYQRRKEQNGTLQEHKREEDPEDLSEMNLHGKKRTRR